MSFHQIAQAAIDRGFSIIPLKPRDKSPLAGWGTTRRTRTVPAGVPEDANVAICADDNFLIFESDNLEALERLLKSGKIVAEIPKTFAVESRPGRRHFYFRQTGKTKAYGKNPSLMGVFELRMREQYVVGPGSIHPKTGEPYKIVVDMDPVPFPDKLFDALQWIKGDARIKTERAKLAIGTGEKIREEEGRHYAILDFCARNFHGDIVPLFAEAMEFNETHCDPPRTAEHVAEIVNWFEDREPADVSGRVLIGSDLMPADVKPSQKGEFIVPRKEGRTKDDGWFVRGEVNLVVGSSGAGKSTIMYQLLEQLREGASFYGHPAATADYVVLSHDRSQKAFLRTANRLGLSEDTRNRVFCLREADRLEHPAVVISRFLKEREKHVPDLIFVEGMDMWVPNAAVNDFNIVQGFLTSLQEVADIWSVALVGSVGSPKQKPKEKYQLQRDNVMGSVAWGRKSETIMYLELSNPENPNSARRMTVLLRNGPSERFTLDWDDGRLVEVEEKAEDDKPLEGTEQTRTLDRRTGLIQYIEGLPIGTVLNLNQMGFFGSKPTLRKDMESLSHPRTGWVTLNDKSKWEVTKQLYRQGGIDDNEIRHPIEQLRGL